MGTQVATLCVASVLQTTQSAVISGNGTHGVVLNSAGVSGTLVQNNRIGSDVNSTLDLGNTLNGIFVLDGAHNNTINALNIIVGNGLSGILLSDPTTTGL